MGRKVRITPADEISESAVASLIYDYLKKNYIERVRHDTYTAISLETRQPILFFIFYLTLILYLATFPVLVQAIIVAVPLLLFALILS